VINATFSRSNTQFEFQTLSSGEEQVSLNGNGPKLLLSHQSLTYSGILRWRVVARGNGAIEFGVVSESMIGNPAALHKEGRTGFASSGTASSNLPISRKIDSNVVEVALNVSGILPPSLSFHFLPFPSLSFPSLSFLSFFSLLSLLFILPPVI
jgi:hypothetical protein